MRITKLDDYQSWYLEAGGARVLVDPWLTEDLRFPLGMFHRTHELRGHDTIKPTHLVITAPFGDHLHPPTLALLDKTIPVLTNGAAAKRMRALGFHDVTTQRAGDVRDLAAGVSLRFVAPAFPYAHNSLGFLLEETNAGHTTRAYLETHVVSPKAMEALPKPIDAVLTTAENVRLFGIQLAMDTRRAAHVAKTLAAKHFVPTGVNPGKSRGVLPALLFVRSDREAFTSALAAIGAQTPVQWLAPGEALEL